MDLKMLLEKLVTYGVGRRKLDDILFSDDKPPPRLGVYDEDEETLCHEVMTSTCNVPGCGFSAQSLLEFEDHYNASHRYSCASCKKVLPSPHLLDLHVQETHDSFFAVLAERKPSYSCYIEACKNKFLNTEQRLEHCVQIHKLPKDFRFDHKPKKKAKNQATNQPMEIDSAKKFAFSNNKQKSFSSYTGRKFTKNDGKNEKKDKDVNMDAVMSELKESLPD